MSVNCNPVAAAEIVGREFIESQLPTKDSFRVNGIFDNIRRINENVGGVDRALTKVNELHGKWTGGSNEFVAFIKNLVGDDPSFISTILEVEKAAEELTSLVSNIEGVIDDSKQLTFSEVSTALTKGYLRNVEMLLPDSVSKRIKSNLQDFPLFTEISESLGSVYYNLTIPDNSIDMVDGILQDTLESTGLSSILSQHTWARLLPEYALNLHNNVRLFQRLGSRVLPKCTYGKVFNIMDEALAHMYDLARDVLFFFDVLDNRKTYLRALINIYGDLLMKVSNYYPLCHQYSVDTPPTEITVGSENILVDILGNPVNTTDNNTTTRGVNDLI